MFHWLRSLLSTFRIAAQIDTLEDRIQRAEYRLQTATDRMLTAEKMRAECEAILAEAKREAEAARQELRLERQKTEVYERVSIPMLTAEIEKYQSLTRAYTAANVHSQVQHNQRVGGA